MSEVKTADASPDAAASSSQRVVEHIVRTIAATIVANEVRFSELDSVVGDGDFGFSLARGFEKVLAELDQLERRTPGAFLKRVAVIITSRCGGTSGPIWGTAFLRAGGALGDRLELDGADIVAALRAAFTGIAQRGGAALGDKTLLDALGPFIERFESEIGRDPSGRGSSAPPAALHAALAHAAETAWEAAEATAALVAKRGRAAYTGERSRGSVDPGAMALAVIAKDLVTALRPSA